MPEALRADKMEIKRYLCRN